jgi:septum formation protein
MIDERAVEATAGSGRHAEEVVALILAEAKAKNVSSETPSRRLVIGSDQTLSLRRRGAAQAGRHGRGATASAGCPARRIISTAPLPRPWRRDGVAHVDEARMTMRPLDPAFIGRHLARVGEKALDQRRRLPDRRARASSCSKIEGDHFTIVGLPLLPLLGELRQSGCDRWLSLRRPSSAAIRSPIRVRR